MLVGQSHVMEDLRARIGRVAGTNFTVLVEGESGSGKELVARAIHANSHRRRGPFVAVNCAALVETLIEAELFGIEDRTATGVKGRKGKFELAHEGTLFLDEIADLSPSAQSKILRAVEYGEFERLGSERMLKTDARIICATNVSLRDRVRQGKFREDLYHRLNGLTILIPALRDRREELPGLIANELKVSALRLGKKITAIHPAAMDRLLMHDWRGNLRELSHTVRTMTLFCDGDVIMPEHVHFPPDLEPLQTSANSSEKSASHAHPDHDGGDLSLASAVKRHVHFVYKQANQNQRRAAKLLGISRATLSRHLRELNHK